MVRGKTFKRIPAKGISAKVAFAWLMDSLEAEALQVLRPASLPARELGLRREVREREWITAALRSD